MMPETISSIAVCILLPQTPHGEEALTAVSNHVARLVPFILRDDRYAVSSG
jgi:hypothetical protein